MFSPVDDAVLQSNPDFAVLYNKLTKVILNPDGTTKDDPAAKERRRVKEELDKHRLKSAKQHLLTRAIATASPSSDQSSRNTSRLNRPQQHQHQHQQQASSLPEPLLDLLLILPPLLDPASPPLPADSTSLLLSSPPLSDLDALLPDLASLLSSHLRSSALNLARITNPTTNPSYLHRHIPTLPQSTSTLTQAATEAHASLATTRLQTLTSLTNLLDEYTTSLTRLIRALEAKHGVVARSLDLRAAEASLRAQHAHTEVESALYNTRAEIYTPEAVAALRSYAAHLRDARIRTGERINGLTAELAEYGVGMDGGETKERTMREMARVYREMGRQIKDTKGDLDRLQKG